MGGDGFPGGSPRSRHGTAGRSGRTDPPGPAPVVGRGSRAIRSPASGAGQALWMQPCEKLVVTDLLARAVGQGEIHDSGLDAAGCLTLQRRPYGHGRQEAGHRFGLMSQQLQSTRRCRFKSRLVPSGEARRLFLWNWRASHALRLNPPRAEQIRLCAVTRRGSSPGAIRVR